MRHVPWEEDQRRAAEYYAHVRLLSAPACPVTGRTLWLVFPDARRCRRMAAGRGHPVWMARWQGGYIWAPAAVRLPPGAELVKTMAFPDGIRRPKARHPRWLLPEAGAGD